jgi:hypothetical protein
VAVGRAFLLFDDPILTLRSDGCFDVEWLSEDMFATAGADQRLFILTVNDPGPVRMLKYVCSIPGCVISYFYPAAGTKTILIK